MDQFQLKLSQQLQQLTEKQKLTEEKQQQLSQREVNLKEELQKLSQNQQNLSDRQDQLTLKFQRLINCLDTCDRDTKRLVIENSHFKKRFNKYRTSIQWTISIALWSTTFITTLSIAESIFNRLSLPQ